MEPSEVHLNLNSESKGKPEEAEFKRESTQTYRNFKEIKKTLSLDAGPRERSNNETTRAKACHGGSPAISTS